MVKNNYEVSKEVLENLKKEMKKVLTNYYYKKDNALDNILKAWLRGKKPLINLFSKHPNWNPEKLMIQFDADYLREFNKDAIYKFSDFIKPILLSKYKVTYVMQLPDCEKEALYFLSKINYQFFDSNMDCFIRDLNETNDAFKIRNNMKASKAIGKISNVLGWDKFKGFNKAYADLCDALNPIKTVRHTCLSLNPIDFLLMSNGNSWSSCHSIRYSGKSAGCYSSGTISYMLDACSFVFYTVDASFNGKDIELEKKLQRQMFGYKPNMILQSRLYPQGNDYGSKDLYDDIRQIVQKVISDCANIPNLWVKTKHEDIQSYVKQPVAATAYPDFEHFSNCNVSIHKSMIDNKDKLKKIVMARQPICIHCGKKHKNTDDLYCPKC